MSPTDSEPASTAQSASRLRLGSAPDSWGVWFPDDPAQVPWHRFLDELATAGYAWLELGPYGYLPTDAGRLAEEVVRRGLRVAGGTVAGALQRAEAWPAVLEATRRVAALTGAVGGRYLVFLPESYRDGRTGQLLEPAELDAEAWRRLVRAASELGQVVGQEYDLRLVFHPHADSHVETPEQVERFLEETEPEHVSLCLDTGHIAYRGGDNLGLIRTYPERIGYVHVKQVDPRVLRIVEAEQLSFGEAVRRGVCCEPPQGVPAIPQVVEALAGLGTELFVIVEQDLYPCAPDVPLPIAIRAREYLRSCGLGQ
jgi:inosose dehydratase